MAIFLAGFKKEWQIAIFSVCVDTISCGTGKRGCRNGNLGPYRTYLGYGFLGAEGVGRGEGFPVGRLSAPAGYFFCIRKKYDRPKTDI